MDIEIRTIDKNQARQMWAAGFPDDTDAFFDAFWELRGKDNTPIGLFDHGKLVSALHAIRQTVQIRGIRVPAMMISGVATRPEERHKGYAAMLMRDVHERIRAAEIPLAMLDPFLEAFYAPFGYVTGTWFRDVSEEKQGDPNGVFQIQDQGCLDSIYRENLAGKSGLILRSAKDWSFRISDLTLENGTVWGDNRTKSYAMTIEQDDCVQVLEHACEDGALKEIMQSISAVYGKPIRYSVSACASESGARHGVMFCPLDMEVLLQMLPVTGKWQGKFSVTDGDGTLSVSVEEEGIRVKRISGCGDIGTKDLWQILLGTEPDGEETLLQRNLQLVWSKQETLTWEQY